jgi:hypothetical protein
MMTAEWHAPSAFLAAHARVMGLEWVWDFVVAENHQKQLGAV